MKQKKHLQEILHCFKKKKADEIISLIEPESKSDIQLNKSYKENEFGSLMTTNFITLEYGIGIKKSIEQLIEEAEENDNTETLYIVKDGEDYVYSVEDIITDNYNYTAALQDGAVPDVVESEKAVQ